MKGYYAQEENGRGLETPTGRLHIEVSNLTEFKALVTQAKYEADQLQQTINRLENFEIDIDFSIGESTSSE